MFLVPDFVVYLSLVMFFCRGRVDDLSSVEEEFGRADSVGSRHVSPRVKGVLVVCLVSLAFEEKLLGVLYGGLGKAVGLWGVGRAEFVGDPGAFAECVEFCQELGTSVAPYRFWPTKSIEPFD